MIQNNQKWWNNGKCNRRSVECPGLDFVEGRLGYKRVPHTKETLEKISKSMKGKSPWNKGKTGVYSEETIQKMKSSKVGYVPKHSNRGNLAWNKGLDASDSRVSSYVEKQKGTTRIGNYISGESHPNYNPNKTEFESYRQQVTVLTEKNYVKYKDEINPNGHPRTLCGVEGGYQLDHIISVKTGFDTGMDPKIISDRNNLQMLSWEQNRNKWSK